MVSMETEAELRAFVARATRTLARVETMMDRLGRWGAEGGHTRARNLTPERRRAIAQKAARARWRKS